MSQLFSGVENFQRVATLLPPHSMALRPIGGGHQVGYGRFFFMEYLSKLDDSKQDEPTFFFENFHKKYHHRC